MKLSRCFSLGGAAFALALNASAQLITIEPDHFPSPTVLNHAFPQISLVTAGADNLPIPFDVTAAYDGFGFASTGTNVFAHAGGIPFWNTNRRLRMDFTTPANYLALDFIGGDLFTNDVAHLDVFNSAGTLLASYVSAPQAPDQVETMFLSRPAGDIAWAVAYLPPEGGNFGRFDNLRFSVVPEPTGGLLLSAGLAAWVIVSKRKGTMIPVRPRQRD